MKRSSRPRIAAAIVLATFVGATLRAEGFWPDEPWPLARRADAPHVELLLVADDEASGPVLESAPPEPPTLEPSSELNLRVPNPYAASAPPMPDESYITPPDDVIAYGAPPRRVGRLRQYWQNRPHQPQLDRESWLNRPYGFSLYVGGMFLDDPRPNRVDGNAGPYFGGRFGWDFSPKWGLETRIGAASPGVSAPNGSRDLAPARLFYTDLSWLWYPTGDTRWRPYFQAGFGYLDINYVDADDFRQHNAALSLPFGVGMKYRHSSQLAMRFDLLDNYAFATGVQEAMHNITVSTGVEFRYGGGTRRNYWPWNPGRDYR